MIVKTGEGIVGIGFENLTEMENFLGEIAAMRDAVLADPNGKFPVVFVAADDGVDGPAREQFAKGFMAETN